MSEERPIALENLKEKLTNAGLKATHQRLVILDEVLRRMDHPTADMIYENVRSKNPSLSLGTIYKTLDTFVEKGLASRVATQGGSMRYDANLQHHNHIYCTDTQEIFDYEDEELNQIILEYLNQKKVKNLKINDIRLQINGNKIDPEKGVNIE